MPDRLAPSAAEYSNGGRNSSSTTSGSRWYAGTPGTYEAPRPARTSRTGVETANRRATVATAVTARTRPSPATKSFTRQVCRPAAPASGRRCQLVTAVVSCDAPTGLDSGDPRWRRYTDSTAIDPT